MKTDVIVYEKKNALTRIAMLGAGEPQEFEFIKENQAAEGNIYLGRITRKLDLAHDKSAFSLTLTAAAKLF